MNHIQHYIEITREMENYVQEQLILLKPIDNCWQSSDFLPEMATPGWKDQVESLRKRMDGLSDDVLVVLIGNMITEEALPSYQTWLNGLEGIGNSSGTSENPWSRWSRGWTAEENRHGELLHSYLLLSGRTDMRAISITIQHLIRNGFDPLTGSHPYEGLVYTSIQERATNIAHKNTGQLAKQSGDETLEKICTQIAGDEARHETAYKRFFSKVLELDPNGALQALENMMGKKVIMPARFMNEEGGQDLFTLHVVAAQRTNVYTTLDYAKVIDHLFEFWDISNLTGLSAEGKNIQERLLNLSAQYHKRASRMESMVARLPKQPCPWIFGRLV